MGLKELTQSRIILYTTIFLATCYNYAFFVNVLKVYPPQINNIGFLISLYFVLIAFNGLLFSLISNFYSIKFTLITIIIISSLTNYFMNNYGIIIDKEMIANTIQTDARESLDLLTFSLVLNLITLGLIPSYFIYRIKIVKQSIKKELLQRSKYIAIFIVMIVVLLALFGRHYTSFFRENKPLRYNINPTYWIYSTGAYIGHFLKTENSLFYPIGEDAKIVPQSERKKMIVFVVGESARADHFSLNGYKKNTSSPLDNYEIISFSNFYSCGTSTSYSVPCMFSSFGRSQYSNAKGKQFGNLLDVLANTGEVAILWRDNNSNSKGQADRVAYQDYKTSKTNPICESNGECRDEGMLVGLDQFIASNQDKNILIVLHQMGNHGPAYYKRYPKEFEKFKPVCNTNQIENCSVDEIKNTYDNALLYTNYFLSKTIDFLKNYSSTYDTAMFYSSDHGESLGENGIYLHAMPYMIAPKEQIHIGTLAWFSESFSEKINTKIDTKKDYSHDNIFHTMLGLFNVQTNVYNKNLDIFIKE